MKLVNTVRLTGALLAGVLLSLFTANAFAANTAANTTISNQASVNYSVNGVTQTVINSAPGTGNSTPGAGGGSATTFLVDDKIVFTVTTVDANDVQVTPGQTGAMLTYKVTNNGNAPQGFTLAVIEEATGTANPLSGGGTDIFDTTSPTFAVSATGISTYNSGTDTATNIATLAGNGGVTYVFVFSNIPLTTTDGQLSVLALMATVNAPGVGGYSGGTGGVITNQSGVAWTPGTVQNIFDDGQGSDDGATPDGKYSSRDAYIVKSALLTITKTASVVSDPTGSATPHAIPGAIMLYTITVANTGSQPATGITLADSINTQITAGNIAYKAGSIALTDPLFNSGNPSACADSGTPAPNASDTCSYTSGTNTVNATIATLAGGKTAVVTFQVTIQ